MGMNWKTIRLELAATREFPTGSAGRAFLLRLPLRDDGSIDEAEVAPVRLDPDQLRQIMDEIAKTQRSRVK